MFTGIVKALGEVTEVENTGGDVRLTIRSQGLDWQDFEPGESISVNGVCLTATELLSDGFATDVSNETLGVTALSALSPGSVVNLEPALALGERLGGHLVTGHVDCTGRVVSVAADARSLRISIEIPGKFSRYVARKGSVCVDGVSLTVNTVRQTVFDLNIIPHTADVTTIGRYNSGTIVNVEVDLLARYIERLLAGEDGGISLEFLKANGYV